MTRTRSWPRPQSAKGAAVRRRRSRFAPSRASVAPVIVHDAGGTSGYAAGGDVGLADATAPPGSTRAIVASETKPTPSRAAAATTQSGSRPSAASAAPRPARSIAASSFAPCTANVTARCGEPISPSRLTACSAAGSGAPSTMRCDAGPGRGTLVRTG
jgi:hypothetical protein